MKYASIRKYDTANWAGVNATIFFSGCTFNCPGCFNKDAQDFNYGNEYTPDVEDLFIEYAKDKHVDNVCILGGEPFQQDLDILEHLLVRLVLEVKKPIIVWTGYLFEDLVTNDKTFGLLSMIDVIIDGKFEMDKRDITLKYRGSYNQRCIDVRKVIKSCEIGGFIYV